MTDGAPFFRPVERERRALVEERGSSRKGEIKSTDLCVICARELRRQTHHSWQWRKHADWWQVGTSVVAVVVVALLVSSRAITHMQAPRGVQFGPVAAEAFGFQTPHTGQISMRDFYHLIESILLSQQLAAAWQLTPTSLAPSSSFVLLFCTSRHFERVGLVRGLKEDDTRSLDRSFVRSLACSEANLHNCALSQAPNEPTPWSSAE